jgi:lipoprotein-anchoring transpeptidase ErfK/SrfK
VRRTGYLDAIQSLQSWAIWMLMRNPRWLTKRWLRGAPALLAVCAIGVLVFGLTAASGGGTQARTTPHHSRSLASLLRPGAHPPATTHRLTSHGHTTTTGQRSAAATGRHTSRQSLASYPIASAKDVALAPTAQVVANLKHATKGYPGRNALMSNRQVPGSWYGHRSGLPVVAATPDRLLVRLAQRPNGATTWINRDQAVLRVTHWAIVIDLSRHFLYAFFNGAQQYAFPVGTGASRTPTPTGQFFVAFHSASNGYGYGPVNLATSAHSNVFRSFDGGDDAIIAIHGPIGSDALIGNHGAAISNGCIRMHLGDLAKVVRHVPDGTPVIVTR